MRRSAVLNLSPLSWYSKVEWHSGKYKSAKRGKTTKYLRILKGGESSDGRHDVRSNGTPQNDTWRNRKHLLVRYALLL